MTRIICFVAHGRYSIWVFRLRFNDIATDRTNKSRHRSEGANANTVSPHTSFALSAPIASLSIPPFFYFFFLLPAPLTYPLSFPPVPQPSPTTCLSLNHSLDPSPSLYRSLALNFSLCLALTKSLQMEGAKNHVMRGWAQGKAVCVCACTCVNLGGGLISALGLHRQAKRLS